jgi:hypothetical protein
MWRLRRPVIVRGRGCAVEHVFVGGRPAGCVPRPRTDVRAVRDPVQPPDLALAADRRKLVQHGLHRGDADARGDEQDRAGAVAQDEGAAGCRHVQDRAGSQVAVQVAAGRAVELLLDADPAGAGGAGLRVPWGAGRRLLRARGLRGPYRPPQSWARAAKTAAAGTIGLSAVALGGRSLIVAAIAGAALVASSALTRFGVFNAGRTSARDARYTITCTASASGGGRSCPRAGSCG